MNVQQIRVSRGNDGQLDILQPKAHRRAIPWRKIALVITPCVLSIVNLVEAGFEKQRAVRTGDNKFEQLRGVGSEAKRLSIAEGAGVGIKDYTGQLQAAENRRRELMQAYQREADSIVNQGNAESSMLVNQAYASKNIFGPLRRISLIYLELARIEAETHHGILLRINDGNPDPPVGKYPVPKIEFLGTAPPSPGRRVELDQLRGSLQKELPALAAVLRTAPARLAKQRVQSIGVCSPVDIPVLPLARRPR